MKEKGFLIIEILIASLILCSSVAATMYLFRVGMQHLERADVSNVFSVKLEQAASLLKTVDLEKGSGAEDLGGGVKLDWQAKLLDQTKPAVSPFQLFLYSVNFTLRYGGDRRDYETNILNYQNLSSGAGE